MMKSLIATLMALTAAACTGGAASDALPKDAPSATSGSGSGSGTRSGDVRRPERTTRVERSLASGTRIDATIQDALSSRSNKPGESVRATVSRDVMGSNGGIVIPAGSPLTMRIEQLEPGSDQVRPEGRLSLAVVSVNVNGQEHPLTANLEPVPHHLQGRGVTKDEAGRIGAGTAIGAIAGQLIGKNTRSTVIGGAVGAVAGGAVAVKYAYRDVIVSAGTPIVITLAQSLNIAAR